MKTSSSAARAASSLVPSSATSPCARAEDPLEPLAPGSERAGEERGCLRRDEMRRAQEPRQVVAKAEVVDAVAELVEHRVRRVVRLDGVREDPDVPAAVDVDAERVLVLARRADRDRCARGSLRPRGRCPRTCAARARRRPGRRRAGRGRRRRRAAAPGRTDRRSATGGDPRPGTRTARRASRRARPSSARTARR